MDLQISGMRYPLDRSLMSDGNDNQKKYIKVSEAKIESYVNFLGGTYNPDNSSCLN